MTGVAALALPDDKGRPFGERLLETVLAILQEKAKCQAKMEGEDDDDDHDNVVMDSVTDLIGMLAKVMGEPFSAHFDVLLPHLLRYMKPSRAHSDRSMALGCFAEVVQEVGPVAAKYVETALPIIQQSLLDEMEGVRRNAVFFAGVLVESVGKDMSPLFTQLLQMMYPLCSRKETQKASDAGGADVDNAISAVARMIKVDTRSVPLEAVLPVMLAALPLRSDPIEGPNVYSCLTGLIVARDPVAISMLPQMLNALGQTLLADSKMTDIVKAGVVSSLKTYATDADLGPQIVAAVSLIPDATMQQVINDAIKS